MVGGAEGRDSQTAKFNYWHTAGAVRVKLGIDICKNRPKGKHALFIAIACAGRILFHRIKYIMSLQTAIPYVRYLEAKKSLDDRSLNRYVYSVLAMKLAKNAPSNTLAILEVGAGIGTMMARLLEWGLLQQATYTALDSRPDFVRETDRYLGDWARQWDFRFEHTAALERIISRFAQMLNVEYQPEALENFLAKQTAPQWDVLVAHAFLDLVDLESTLPELVRVVKPGGYLYLTLNFDGGTTFEPPIDPVMDAKIESLYHASMETRQIAGRPAGSSHTGRQLFTSLRQLGLPILAAGSSDWVVCAGAQGYPEDEAFFLSFILDTIENSLGGLPEQVADRFPSWMDTRRAQLEAGELVYIAHQLDILAVRPEL